MQVTSRLRCSRARLKDVAQRLPGLRAVRAGQMEYQIDFEMGRDHISRASFTPINLLRILQLMIRGVGISMPAMLSLLVERPQ